MSRASYWREEGDATDERKITTASVDEIDDELVLLRDGESIDLRCAGDSRAGERRDGERRGGEPRDGDCRDGERRLLFLSGELETQES